MSGGMLELANIYGLHIYKPGPKCTEVKSWACFRPRQRSSRSQRQQQCPHWARETCSADGSLLPPKLPRAVRPSFLSLLTLSDRCFLSRVVYKSMSRERGGRLRPSRTLQRGGRARNVVSHETVSHPGQMVSEVTILKLPPHC